MDMNYLRDQEGLKQSTQKVDEERRAFLTAGLVGGAIAAGTLVARRRAGQGNGSGAAHVRQAVVAPSQMGQGRSGGASNWITPAKVLDTIEAHQRRQDLSRRPRLRERRMPLVRPAHLQHPHHTGLAAAVRHQPAARPRRVPGRPRLARPAPSSTALASIGLQMGKPGDPERETRFYNGVTGSSR